jgi:hypothetical protein
MVTGAFGNATGARARVPVPLGEPGSMGRGDGELGNTKGAKVLKRLGREAT